MKITVTINPTHLDPEGETKGAALNRPAAKFGKQCEEALLSQFPKAQISVEFPMSGESAYGIKIAGGGKGLDLQTRTDFAMDAMERVHCNGSYWN
jgi:hypothetical protein